MNMNMNISGMAQYQLNSNSKFCRQNIRLMALSYTDDMMTLTTTGHKLRYFWGRQSSDYA